MCQTNTATFICNTDISTYIATKSKGKNPSIIFCDSIKGKVAQAILTCADTAPGGKAQSPERHDFAKAVTDNAVKFWDLVKACNLKHIKNGPREYKDIIIPGFKKLVIYQAKQVAAHGLLVWDGSSRKWIRNVLYEFQSDAELGKWLHEKRSLPRMSTFQHANTNRLTPPMNASRYSDADGLASSFKGMNLEPITERPQSRYSTIPAYRPMSAGNVVSSQPALTPRPTPENNKVNAWSRKVSRSSVQDQLERLGQEYEDRMMEMHEFSVRQGKIWAQI